MSGREGGRGEVFRNQLQIARDETCGERWAGWVAQQAWWEGEAGGPPTNGPRSWQRTRMRGERGVLAVLVRLVWLEK